MIDTALPTDARIYVAGHRGMVGSALVRQLIGRGYERIVTRTHADLDLIDQRAVEDFFRREPIDIVLLAAAKVGGIYANDTYRADFIYENLMMQCNVIHAAFKAGVRRLLFLGSSCIYPRGCPQPMREEDLLTGSLEPTNEPYAVAKIAGIKMCDSYNRQYGTDYRAVMPTNLYGPNDNFDLESSHVLPAMLRKFHLTKLARAGDLEGIRLDEQRFGQIPEDVRAELQKGTAARVQLWGTGSARREFLHVDDMAAACVFVIQLPKEDYGAACAPCSHVNIGSGEDRTIRVLSGAVRDAVGVEGAAVWDSSRPDGMPRKLLDASRLQHLGWQPDIGLAEGIRSTYAWYLSQLQ
jgi:GDP-L-fucose synthase